MLSRNGLIYGKKKALFNHVPKTIEEIKCRKINKHPTLEPFRR